MVNPALVLLPLYIYPDSVSWPAVESAVAANPSVIFQVVVAPRPVPAVPKTDFTPALEKLNGYANVETLGYVPTSWTNRDISLVEGDITNYAAWNSYSFAVKGIFFDEATAVVSTATFDWMSNITSFAKSALGSGRDKLLFNPGIPVDSSFHTLADEINIFENSSSAFNLATLQSKVSSTLLAKSAIIIYEFSGTAAGQTQLVDSIISANAGGLYTTTTDGYTSLSSLWSQFCSEVASED